MAEWVRVYHFYDKGSIWCDRSAHVLGGCNTMRDGDHWSQDEVLVTDGLKTSQYPDRSGQTLLGRWPSPDAISSSGCRSKWSPLAAVWVATLSLVEPFKLCGRKQELEDELLFWSLSVVSVREEGVRPGHATIITGHVIDSHLHRSRLGPPCQQRWK